MYEYVTNWDMASSGLVVMLQKPGRPLRQVRAPRFLIATIGLLWLALVVAGAYGGWMLSEWVQ